MQQTILVADDEPIIRDFLADLLREEGYAVLTAADGRTALAAVGRTSPDLVISDVMMPGVDGVDVARSLRERGIPVVLMTAAGRCPSLPGVTCVPKPFDLDAMLATVDRELHWTGSSTDGVAPLAAAAD